MYALQQCSFVIPPVSVSTFFLLMSCDVVVMCVCFENRLFIRVYETVTGWKKSIVNNNNKNIDSKLACRVSNHRFSRLYRLTRLEVEGAAAN